MTVLMILHDSIGSHAEADQSEVTCGRELGGGDGFH
eukprot:CAMPEP_0182420726 /NCGR_PEP_ID=MMETSP1167-20130531/5746_1 /TAXON_ID=2988 /ORGANISM="Mallomonas Sp, Strain CCMP3275" /LENGTH=35 /DNA_ID= /DNA_START= /DNA_END= /DNA_ORIENTATION=